MGSKHEAAEDGQKNRGKRGGLPRSVARDAFRPLSRFLPPPQDELATFIARVNPGVQLTQAQMDTVLEEASALRV